MVWQSQLSSSIRADEQRLAREILDTTGVKGGLVVHVAGGDEAAVERTIALRANESYLVHALYTDAARIADRTGSGAPSPSIEPADHD